MKKKAVLILIPVLVLAIAFGGWFTLHEKAQNKNIATLIEKVDTLSQSVQELASRANREEKAPVEWGDGYKWMAIGNSLTLIEAWGRNSWVSTQYWWSLDVLQRKMTFRVVLWLAPEFAFPT